MIDPLSPEAASSRKPRRTSPRAEVLRTADGAVPLADTGDGDNESDSGREDGIT